MWKETGVGLALALLVALAVSGVDVTPLVLVGVMAALLYFLMETRGMGRRFEVVNGGQGSHLTVTFDDIGGQEVAKREFVEALDFVKHADQVARLGIRPLRGILLTGPPGTGKTLMAKAAANYTDSVFLAASGSQFVEMYAGVGAQRVRALFQQARQQARKAKKNSAIIFLDEIDVLGKKRGSHTGHVEYDQTLNQLLVEMDGLQASDDVRILVVGATNRPDMLDSALLRPGRFDRIVNVDLPDREGRRHILAIHTAGKPLAPDVDLDALARETFGFSGAHLESLVNEAAIQAMREGQDRITAAHFREAVEKVMMGEKMDRRLREEERQRIAYHEVGHAVISELVRPGSVASITVTSRGRALGYVRQAPDEDPYLYTYDDLVGQIAVCLAGALSEELHFGSRSTGATGDFQEALRLAERIIDAGMSSLGIVNRDRIPPPLVHEEVQSILRSREAWVRQQLQQHQELIHRVAARLLEQERISGEELRQMMKEIGSSPCAVAVGDVAASEADHPQPATG